MKRGNKMKEILELIDELLEENFASYCMNHSCALEQNIKRFELESTRERIENLLEEYDEEVALRERNNCEEERAELISDYENEIDDLRSTMREFLERLDIDLYILRKEAYND